jgi:rod shape-determining protein MreC
MLIVLSHHSSGFEQFRARISVIVTPIQYLVNWPIEIFYSIKSSFVQQRKLLDENAELRAKELLLNAKLQRFLALERENEQLRALLRSSSGAVDGKFLVAQILAVDLDPSTQQLVLNKGSKEGVFVGQPVLDAHGVMGQIMQVGIHTSIVLLITDTQSGVPVEINRNNLRAIAVGQGDNNNLTLLHMLDTADIRPGDLLVTSGLAHRFPPGYPVGVVTSVKHQTGERFSDIQVKVNAHINQSQQVLLIWPPKTADL